MKKVKITINNFSEQGFDKEIILEVNSCQKTSKKDNIDYLYTKKADKNPNLNYFEIETNGKIKILATNGKVELIESPTVQENITQTWEAI